MAWYSGNAYEMYTRARRSAVRARTRSSTGRSSSATASSCRRSGAAACARARVALFVVAALRPDRDVVRALHAHRHVAAPRLPAVELARLRAELDRLDHPRRARCSFFLFLFLLFLRFVPFIPISELKEMRHELAADASAEAASRPCVSGHASPSSTDARGGSSARSLACRRSGYTRLDRGRPTRCERSSTQLPESLVPWIMLARGPDAAPRSATSCSGGATRTTTGSTSAGARSTRSRRTSRSRSSRRSSRRRSPGSSRSWRSRGLPRLYHPIFEVDGFERASVDRFWLGVDASDPRFDDEVRRRARVGSGALRCAARRGRR